MDSNIYDSVANNAIYSPTAYPLNQWLYVTMTANSATEYLYVDGVQVSSHATGAMVWENGSKNMCMSYHYAGGIDDLRIYNRALSAAEIAQLYAGSAPPNCDQTCKGWWKFDESSGTSAADSTGLGHTGTVTGGTWTTGIYSNGLSLNGTSNYVTLPDLGFTSGTVGFWIDPTTVTGDQRLFSQASGASTQAGTLALNQSSGESGSLWVWDGSTWQRLSPNGSIVANTWNQIAVDYNGSSATAWVNGTQYSTATAGCTFNGVSVSVGGPSWGTTGGYFSGAIDDLRVYTRHLQGYEVADQYRSAL